MSPKSVTVHNTANPNATAMNHEAYLNSAPRSASWHITVDDKHAIMHIPLTEQAWHAGTTAGNTTSVGIEVCEFSDAARQKAAEANAAQLIAEMLTGKAPKGWNLNGAGVKLANVVTHKYWSGKLCPRVILPHWTSFKADIQKRMTALTASPTSAVTYYEIRIHTSGPEVASYKALAQKNDDFIKVTPTPKDSWKTW
jgi:N-acetylmuramoyl-L-alanine amidase